jgi:hypothetical protein
MGFTEFLQLQARIPISEYEEFASGFRPEDHPVPPSQGGNISTN